MNSPDGLSQEIRNQIKNVFRKYDSIEKAVLYGSRAKGNFKLGSDIDLTLYGPQLDLDLLLQIENELDDLLLPYKVDLSIFNKIENEELREHINRVGVLFYSKTGSVE
jgi:type I restriction enzyme S subunit